MQPTITVRAAAETVMHRGAYDGASQVDMRPDRLLKFSGDQIVLGANPLLAVDPLEPVQGEMTPRHILEMFDERIVDRTAAPRAPTMGRACAATFCVTTTPNRVATCVTNFSKIGEPSPMTPRSATNRAASVTDHRRGSPRRRVRRPVRPNSYPRSTGARRFLGSDLLGPIIQRCVRLAEERCSDWIVEHDLLQLQHLPSRRVFEPHLMTEEMSSMLLSFSPDDLGGYCD
jgi:hypothetical protein